MKKVGSILLAVALLVICCAGCSDSKAPEEDSCAHEWVEATCTEPKTCSLCGETEGEALGHTEGPTLCERCHENLTTWEIDEYVDEFDQPTGEKFAYTRVTGTFSNSATTNSKLTAYMQVSASGIDIMLYEYGDMVVDGTFSTGNVYDISVLDQNGEKHKFTGSMAHNATKLHLSRQYEEEMLNLLAKGGVLRFYLTYEKYTKSTYSFDIDATGAYGIIYLALL